jgi:putative membrane protein
MTESAATASDSPLAARVIYGLSLFVVLAISVVIFGVPSAEVPTTPSFLATLNACLNGTVGLCLLAGFNFVRQKRIAAHRVCMLAAFALSSVFLITYLIHHGQVGSVPFRGEGWIRTVYFALLIPHIVLAAVILPLALFTIYRGWTARIELHRKVARWTLPIWLFVSFSGVAVYLMLYYS